MYTPEEFTPNKLSTCRAIELKDKQSAGFACPPGSRFPLGWSSIRVEQGAVRWEKVAAIVCMATIHSLTHSVSSSITLISSARARFCLHFCQSSFLFSLFPRQGKKKRKRKRRQRHCQSEYWELWEHSDSSRHKTVRDVFDFANCGTFNNTKCLLLRCLPFLLSLCPFSAFLSCLPFYYLRQ